MRGDANDHLMTARSIVSMHAVDGMDERVKGLARDIGDARRTLTEAVKKVTQLAEAIEDAQRFLEHGKASWKAQRAEVIPALRAAQEMASRISGTPLEEASY